MIFVDQSYTDLQLSIYSGDVDVSSLQIITQQKRILSPALTLQAGIIGASHFIKIQSNNFFFTEVFACAAVPATNCTQLYHAPFTQLSPLQIKGLPAITYQFTHQFKQLSDQAQINEILAQRIATLSPKGIHLSYTFPTLDKNTLAARTVVLTDVSDDFSRIHTFTIHEYPNESVIVTNESQFKIVVGD